MRFRSVAVALLVCGSVLIAGCPDGTDFGLGCGCDVIADGEYEGSFSSNVEWRNAGDLYDQVADAGDAFASFYSGALLADSGDYVQIDDVEYLDVQGVSITRQVFDIEYGDWAYEVSYDVWADWDTVPMVGTEYITYYENEDGSITMIDTIELVSTDAHDGGAWTFHGSSSGTLALVNGTENPPDDILDHKSGKPRQ